MWLSVAIIGAFILFSMLFWTTNIGQSDKFNKYVGFVSVFSTNIIVGSFIITLQQNDREAKQRAKDDDLRQAALFTSETEKNWIDLEKMFKEDYPYLAQLYREMYPENPNIPTPTLTPEQEIEAKVKEEHACAIIFQTIENIISTTQSSPDQDFGWPRIFSSWTKSAIFQENWQYSKQFYNPTTQRFIDGLIGKASAASRVPNRR